MRYVLLISIFIIVSCSTNKNVTSAVNSSPPEAEVKAAEVIKNTFDFPFQNPALTVKERVEDLIGRMSLEEKVGQLMYSSPAIPRLGIPEYNWWNECLHGVARNGRATVFPQAIGMAASWDTDIMHRIGVAVSDEARAKFNINIKHGNRERYQGLTFWTPNVNIFRDPRWGRGQETYGEDPLLTSKIGVSYVKGLQGDHPKYLKSAAMAKHYAVHNGPEESRHVFDAVVGMKDLWETYLPAFEALVVDANVEGVMGAYNRTNGEPCCAHPYLMDEVLRKQWNFDGYFVSDCWAIVDFYEGHKIVDTAPEAAALALNSGCNLNCGSTYPELINSIKQGLTTEAMVDENLRELLPTRFDLGLMDPVGLNPYDAISYDVVRSEKHVALARESAAKSMVLLKNKEDILPLKKDLSSIFVCGPTATHAQALLANYYGVSDNLVTFLEGITGKVSNHTLVRYSQSALLDEPNKNPMDWYSEYGKLSDVTVACVGISQLIEGEEGESIQSQHKGDRKDIGLPPSQVEFLKKMRSVSKKLVVVVTSGSAMAIPEVHEMADAVVYAWYPGEQGGNALADVLFGDVSPSGRLPVTVPYSVDDLPPFEDYNMSNRTYKYAKKEPLYPFGFGLSYGDFVYSNLTIDKTAINSEGSVNATVTVTNKGDVKSDEVVQLYMKDVEASSVQPFCALKDFKRVSLAPGSTQEISFTITPKMMEMVDDEGNKKIEAGEFKVMVGGAVPTDRSKSLGASEHQEVSFRVK